MKTATRMEEEKRLSQKLTRRFEYATPCMLGDRKMDTVGIRGEGSRS